MYNSQTVTKKYLQMWLQTYIGKLNNIPSHDIDIEVTFDRYGLDSSTAICLINDLEELLKIELSVNLILDCPNINKLSEQLVKQVHLSNIETDV